MPGPSVAPLGGVLALEGLCKGASRIPAADVALNGGASWKRLLAEVEVAVRLAQVPQEAMKNIALAAICAGGTGVHGHQRWEEPFRALKASKVWICGEVL